MSRSQEFNLGTFNAGHAMRDYHYQAMSGIHADISQSHRDRARPYRSGNPKGNEHLAKAKASEKQSLKSGRKRDKINAKSRKIKPAIMESLPRPTHRNLANES